jgi:hypothetical protein
MAKEQNLSLNPTKISGLCGRLMCCLKYEQDNYEAVLKRVPRVGKDVVTPDGVGVITEINAIKEQVKVRIRTAEDNFDIREYAIDDVRRPGPGDSAAVREQPKVQEKRPRKGAEPEQPEEESAEENKKKRYPHQKAPKNMSTDQFLEKMKETEETDDVPAEKPEKEVHEPAEGKEPKEKEGGQHKKRRRGGKGRHREEGAQSEAAVPSEKGDQPAKHSPAKVEKPAAEAE